MTKHGDILRVAHNGVGNRRVVRQGSGGAVVAGRVERIHLDREPTDARVTLDRHLHGLPRARPEGRAEPGVIDRDRDLHRLTTQNDELSAPRQHRIPRGTTASRRERHPAEHQAEAPTRPEHHA